jgi:hypothetical protein
VAKACSRPTMNLREQTDQAPYARARIAPTNAGGSPAPFAQPKSAESETRTAGVRCSLDAGGRRRLLENHLVDELRSLVVIAEFGNTVKVLDRDARQRRGRAREQRFDACWKVWRFQDGVESATPAPTPIIAGNAGQNREAPPPASSGERKKVICPFRSQNRQPSSAGEQRRSLPLLA